MTAGIRVWVSALAKPFSPVAVVSSSAKARLLAEVAIYFAVYLLYF